MKISLIFISWEKAYICFDFYKNNTSDYYINNYLIKLINYLCNNTYFLGTGNFLLPYSNLNFKFIPLPELAMLYNKSLYLIKPWFFDNALYLQNISTKFNMFEHLFINNSTNIHWIGILLVPIIYNIFLPYLCKNIIIFCNNVMLYIAVFGNFLYLILGLIYDYISCLSRIRNFIIYNKLVTKLILGLIYLFFIFTGVYSSNALYFYFMPKSIYINNKIVFLIVTYILSVLGAGIWYIFRLKVVNPRYDLLNSFFRSFFELVCFNAIAFSTYIIWSYFINMTNYELIGITVFIPLHLGFSSLSILCELSDVNFILYGIIYSLSFTFGVIGTNSIFVYINAFFTIGTIKYIIFTILAGISTSALHLNVYRNSNSSNTIEWYYIIFSVIKFFCLFIAFVSATGLIWNLINF